LGKYQGENGRKKDGGTIWCRHKGWILDLHLTLTLQAQLACSSSLSITIFNCFYITIITLLNQSFQAKNSIEA